MNVPQHIIQAFQEHEFVPRHAEEELRSYIAAKIEKVRRRIQKFTQAKVPPHAIASQEQRLDELLHGEEKFHHALAARLIHLVAQGRDTMPTAEALGALRDPIVTEELLDEGYEQKAIDAALTIAHHHLRTHAVTDVIVSRDPRLAKQRDTCANGDSYDDVFSQLLSSLVV